MKIPKLKLNFRSLGAKLIISFLLVSLIPLVPLLAMSTYSYNLVVSHSKQTQQSSYQDFVINIAQNIDEILSRKKEEMMLLAKTPTLIRGTNKERIDYLKNVRKIDEELYSSFIFLDPKGIAVGHTTDKNVNIDLSAKDYFQSGIQGKTIYSKISISSNTGRRLLIIGTPVLDEADKIIGVLATTLPFELLVNAAMETDRKEGKTGALTLIDTENNIQYHATKELLGISLDKAGLNQALTTLMSQKLERPKLLSYQENGATQLVFSSLVTEVGYKIFMDVPESALNASATDDTSGSSLSMKLIITLTILIAILLIVGIAIVLAKRTARPIIELITTSEQISNGDLTKRIQVRSKDEMGQLGVSFNRMVESLQQVIIEISDTSNQLAASSQQLTASSEQTSQATEHIASSIQSIAEGTEQQAKNMDESTQSIETISEHIEQIAANSQQISTTAQSASEKSHEGVQAIQIAMAQIHSINSTVESLSLVIQELDGRSQQIGQILQTISGIAQQTNLLALNAGIEAARAGEHGRGFAVVATEIRKLAEQSRESAGHIADLINNIQEETGKAVVTMAGATSEVLTGIDVVDTAGQLFQNISESVNELSEQMQQVSLATHKISAGTRQVVDSFQTFSQVAVANAEESEGISAAAEEQLASVQEISASSAELSRMAEKLAIVVDRFKI